METHVRAEHVRDEIDHGRTARTPTAQDADPRPCADGGCSAFWQSDPAPGRTDHLTPRAPATPRPWRRQPLGADRATSRRRSRAQPGSRPRSTLARPPIQHQRALSSTRSSFIANLSPFQLNSYTDPVTCCSLVPQDIPMIDLRALRVAASLACVLPGIDIRAPWRGTHSRDAHPGDLPSRQAAATTLWRSSEPGALEVRRRRWWSITGPAPAAPSRSKWWRAQNRTAIRCYLEAPISRCCRISRK